MCGASYLEASAREVEYNRQAKVWQLTLVQMNRGAGVGHIPEHTGALVCWWDLISFSEYTVELLIKTSASHGNSQKSMSFNVSLTSPKHTHFAPNIFSKKLRQIRLDSGGACL